MTTFSFTYELPSEETLMSLPSATLKDLATKHGLKTYGTK